MSTRWGVVPTRRPLDVGDINTQVGSEPKIQVGLNGTS